ncbi:MAG: hypothetical protein HQL70_01570 [Magnetococcales bacterium]|nr:hypothetical protein [Magnetococcales bacterium]
MENPSKTRETSSSKGLSRLLGAINTSEPGRAKALLLETVIKLGDSNSQNHKKLLMGIRNPARVLTQLGRREARLLWSTLPPPVRVGLTNAVDQKTLDNLDLNRAIGSSSEGIDEKKAIEEFYNVLRDLRDSGKIRWERLLESVIEPPKCEPPTTPKTWQDGGAILLDPIVAIGGAARILIVGAEKRPKACHMTITYSAREVERQIAEAQIDYGVDGLAFWRTPPLLNPGLYKVIVTTPDSSLQSCHTIAVARAAQKPLKLSSSLMIWSGKDRSRSLEFRGRLDTNSKESKESKTAVHSQLICGGCGHVTDEKTTTANNKRFSAGLHCYGHQGPYYLQLTEKPSGQRQLFSVADSNLDIPKDSEGIRVTATLNQKFNGHLKLAISQAKTGILIASHAGAELTGLDLENLNDPAQPLAPAHSFQIMNDRVLESSHNFAMNVDFQPILGAFRISELDGSHLEFDISCTDPLFGIRLHFLHRLPDGKWSVAQTDAREAPNDILLNMPQVAMPDDHFTGWVISQAETHKELVVEVDGNSASTQLKQKCKTPVQVSSGVLPELSVTNGENHTPLWRWNNFDREPLLIPTAKEPETKSTAIKERPFLTSSKIELNFRYMQPGEKLPITNGSVVIFPNLKWLAGFAAERMVTGYPMRCSEQTSSILSCLWTIKELIAEGYQAGLVNSKQLDTLIAEEINRLYCFQHDDGILDLWPRLQLSEYEQLGNYAYENSWPPPEKKDRHKTKKDKGESVTGKVKNLLGIGGSKKVVEEEESQEQPELFWNPEYESKMIKFYATPPMAKQDSQAESDGSPSVQAKLEEIVWQNLYDLTLNSPDALDSFLDRLDPHIKELLGQEKPYETELENSAYHCMQSSSSDKANVAVANSLAATIQPGENTWNIRNFGLYKNSAYFSGLMLDYCAHRPEELKGGPLSEVGDPVAALLNGLFTSQADGFWGTSGTVRTIRGLLNLDRKNPLNPNFLIDSKELKNPSQPIVVYGEELTVMDGNALVAEISPIDPLHDFKSVLDVQELPDCKVKLDWANLTTPTLRAGSVYLLEISLEGSGLDNPMAMLAISGLLRLDDKLEDGMGSHPGGVRMALPGRMVRIALRAVRVGSGKISVMVRNMYDYSETMKEQLDFTVQ